MQIQVNTDNNIEGSEQLASHVRSVVESALNRFSDRITRVEVHLGDENGRKSGQADKRCMMEARIEGRQPTNRPPATEQRKRSWMPKPLAAHLLLDRRTDQALIWVVPLPKRQQAQV